MKRGKRPRIIELSYEHVKYTATPFREGSVFVISIPVSVTKLLKINRTSRLEIFLKVIKE